MSKVSRRKRLLIWVEGWGYGGIESCVMNLIRSSDFQRREYGFTIFCVTSWNNSLDDEIARLGGERISVFSTKERSLPKKLVKSIRKYVALLWDGRFDGVYINATNGTGFIYTFIAKLLSIKCRIIHSHNSDFDDRGKAATLKKIIHRVCRALFSKSASCCIACSKKAGMFLFGENIPYHLVPNGIDVGRFRFDETARMEIRRDLGVSDNCALIGNIGRIDERKNPLFIVKICSELVRLGENVRLLLVGDGAQKEDVLSLACQLGISERMIIQRSTDAPERYYSALDELIMPSITEGFGLVALEAQSSGLPVLMSSALPGEVALLSHAKRLNISDGAPAWAECARSLLKESSSADRRSLNFIVRQSEFDQGKMVSRINKYISEGMLSD